MALTDEEGSEGVESGRPERGWSADVHRSQNRQFLPHRSVQTL